MLLIRAHRWRSLLMLMHLLLLLMLLLRTLRQLQQLHSSGGMAQRQEQGSGPTDGSVRRLLLLMQRGWWGCWGVIEREHGIIPLASGRHYA